MIISSIGTAVPKYKVNQNDAVARLSKLISMSTEEEKLLKRLYKSSGINSRHSVIPDFSDSQADNVFWDEQPRNNQSPSTYKRMSIYKNNALPLAIQAISSCLVQNQYLNISDITHIITVSCTGMYAPGLDIEIIKHFGMKSSTPRTTINFMGCYGAFNGMKVASAFCKENPSAKVLLVCVELCSIHFQDELSMSNVVSNAIFSDGAAAALIEADSASARFLNLDTFHCDIAPDSEEHMSWNIGNHGFEMVLDSYVPSLIKFGINHFFKTLLNKTDICIDDIDDFAIHPGGIKILQGCEQALDIPKEKIRSSYSVLGKFGNMSSATILFVLKDIIWTFDKPA